MNTFKKIIAALFLYVILCQMTCLGIYAQTTAGNVKIKSTNPDASVPCFYHENGFFESISRDHKGEWNEYLVKDLGIRSINGKPIKIDDLHSTYKYQREDDNYYYLVNSNGVAAVPKKVGGKFYWKKKGATNFIVVYGQRVKHRKCTNCNGSGTERCTICFGTGMIGRGEYATMCPNCIMGWQPCQICFGKNINMADIEIQNSIYSRWGYSNTPIVSGSSYNGSSYSSGSRDSQETRTRTRRGCRNCSISGGDGYAGNGQCSGCNGLGFISLLGETHVCPSCYIKYETRGNGQCQWCKGTGWRD